MENSFALITNPASLEFVKRLWSEKCSFIQGGQQVGRQGRQTGQDTERDGKKTRLDLHLNWWAKKASGGRERERGIKVFLLQTRGNSQPLLPQSSVYRPDSYLLIIGID